MATCPNGHESTWDDYCSSCGVAMVVGDPDAAAMATPSAGTSAGPDPSAPDAGGASCPHCGDARHAEAVFCENCGYDYLTGSLPAAEAADADAPPKPSAAEESVIARIEVATDREYFDHMVGEGQLDYPDPDRTPTTVEVRTDEVHVGRRSESRGRFPDIDLTGAHDDPAASHEHAVLERAADGSWTITDLGSTNGTYVESFENQLADAEPVALEIGTPVYIGAWTRLTLLA